MGCDFEIWAEVSVESHVRAQERDIHQWYHCPKAFLICPLTLNTPAAPLEHNNKLMIGRTVILTN